MSELNKSELVSRAKNCFENGEYVSVITHMKEIIRLGCPLNYSERRLIYGSFRQLKYPYYDIFRHLNTDESLQNDLILKTKEALRGLCNDAIYLLDDGSVEKDISKEAIADHKRFEGGQYYDLAFCKGNDCNEVEKSKAIELLKEATEISKEYLNPAHPVRLKIANYSSNFYSELLDDDKKAFEIAKEAYEMGLRCLPQLTESLKNPAKLQLELLKKLIDSGS